MARVTLTPTEGSFRLERDSELLATLTPDDVLALANIAPNLRQSAMGMLTSTPGAVFATPILDTGATWDALGESVLLVLVDESGGRTVFEMDSSQAEALVERLSSLGSPPFPSEKQ